jgi:hypothetical protein
MPARLFRRSSSIALILAAALGSHASARPPLAYAPADTPYVFGAIEPPSAEISDAWIARDDALPRMYAPMLREWLGNTADTGADTKQQRALLKAINAEVETRGLGELMERWGLSRQPRAALFGLGLLPVARIELADTERFREALLRFTRSAAMPLRAADIDGQAYWLLGPDSSEGGVLLALHDGQLVLSLLPRSAAEGVLRAVLGLDLPAESVLDAGSLQALNARLGLLPQGSGYLDSARLWALISGAAEGPQAALMRELGWALPEQVSPACEAQAQDLIQSWPRMAAGYAAIDERGYRLRYLLEAKPALVKKLEGLQAPLIASADADAAGARLALSLRSDRLIALINSWSGAFSGECTGGILSALKLAELSSALNNPVAAWLAQHLPSLHAQIDHLRWPVGDQKLELQASLQGYTPDLTALLADMARHNPDFPADLQPGEPPRAIDLPSGLPREATTHIAAGAQSLGLAVGDRAVAALPDRLASAPSAPTLLEFGYSGAFYQSLMEQVLQGQPDSETMLVPNRHHGQTLDRAEYSIEVSEFGLEFVGELKFH